MQEPSIQRQLYSVTFPYQIINILKKDFSLFSPSDLADGIFCLAEHNKIRKGASAQAISYVTKSIKQFCDSARFQELIEQLVLNIPNMKPTHFPKIAWALVTLKIEPEKAILIIKALALQAQKNISLFSVQELRNIMLVFGHYHIQSPEIENFMNAAAKKIHSKLDQYSLKQFSSILQCFALLNLKGEPVQRLAQKMASIIRKNIHSLTPQELAIFAETLALVTTNTAEKTPAMLFTQPGSTYMQSSTKTATEVSAFMRELAKQQKSILTLPPKQLVSLASTFVKLGIEGIEVRNLFQAMGSKIQKDISTFSRKELSAIAYHFTHLNCFDNQFFQCWKKAVDTKSKTKPLSQEMQDFQRLYLFCEKRSAASSSPAISKNPTQATKISNKK